MIEIKGKYNSVKVFNNNAENTALSQIYELLNQEFIKDSKIRIMPDVHSGAGCVIGTTMTIKNKMVVPNLVGVDIGCGMEVVKLSQKKRELDLNAIDKLIRNEIPSGFEVRDKKHNFLKNTNLEDLKSLKNISKFERVNLSLGTLGGGNHFIELNEDDNENIYIVIHSGSRNLGKQIAEYYQKLGYDLLTDMKDERKEVIEKCKREKREKDIPKEIALVMKEIKFVNKNLAYVFGKNFDDYIYDMRITQEFALWNRKAMMDVIIKKFKFDIIEQFTTIHNYIDIDNMILRKGAISAQKNEKVIIPMNMRDGSLICIGKGNEDWNYSAPHGAGRLMSRGKAKDTVKMEDYKKSMEGIFTTCVNSSTVDESPFAYKPMKEIIDNIGDTVEVKNIIKPIYNYKAN